MSSTFKDITDTGNQAIAKAIDLFRSARSTDLIQYTRVGRVEPITIVDAPLATMEETPKILQSLSSIFSGLYLQAAAISVNVGKVNTIRLLDKLNPNRDVIDSGLGALQAVGESTMESNYMSLISNNPAKFTEMDKLQTQRKSHLCMEARGETPRTENGVGADDRNLKAIYDNTDLSVGKFLEVTIDDGVHKATIPITVRLDTKIASSATVADVFGYGLRDDSIGARYRKLRLKEITFWKDLVCLGDIAYIETKRLRNDKEGIYQAMLGNRTKNKFAAIVSGQPSVAQASAMAVITKETAEKIETIGRLKLSSHSKRKLIFDKTTLMILCVYDQAYEEVTVYYRNIKRPTVYATRDLKRSGGGKGDDIKEMLQAFVGGQAPSASVF